MRVLRWAGRLWTGVLLTVVVLAGMLLGARLALPLFADAPAVVGATPPEGAGDIAPRTRLTLRFSTPMNPRSVDAALALDPPAPAELVWDAGRTTLTISPTVSLRPDTAYRLTVGGDAVSRLLSPLGQPFALNFRTAPAPAVVAVSPAPGSADVGPEAPITITFSRAIVPTATLALPAQLPALHLAPFVRGTATWLTQHTVIFRPASPLSPATRYRATISGGLVDLAGGELGEQFSWTFATPAPLVAPVAPAPGARWVAPRASLVLTSSHPLDLPALSASLAISPTISGTLSATALAGGGQQITYTPSADWLPGTVYTAAVGEAAAGGALSLAEPLSWTFTTAPRPAVTGRFPGEGQTLPLGQDIRLIFSTPMDAALVREAVLFDPPIESFDVSAIDTQVRIVPDVRASTLYTMTLRPVLSDRNGVLLGREYQFRFVTGSAPPALELPSASGHIVQLASAQPLQLAMVRTNLSALNLELYQLDGATSVRTLTFREGDWAGFQPERYGQPLLRAWSASLSDPLNAPAPAALDLAAEDAPLVPGAYYLRIRTPEGPRADVLVLVSQVDLALARGQRGVVVWAVDRATGAPLPELPLALYQEGALIARGATDSRGLWAVERPTDQARTLIAYATAGQPAVAASRAGALSAPARSAVFLTTDREVYRAGERVSLAGFVRTLDAGEYALPSAAVRATITAGQAGSAGHVFQETVEIGSGGVLSDSFVLPAAAQPGPYRLLATIGDERFVGGFVVEPLLTPTLVVGVQPLPATAGDVPVTISVDTPEGLPSAGATISWTVEPELLPLPAPEGFTIGDDEVALPQPVSRFGAGQAGPDGLLTVVVTGTLEPGPPARYRVLVGAAEPFGTPATARATFVVRPPALYPAIRMPTRIWQAGQPAALDIMTVDGDGRPVADAVVRLEIYRRQRLPDGEVRDERVVARRATTGADATVAVDPVVADGGEYRVVVSAVGPAGQTLTSATTIWATSAGFTGWSGPMLASDRPAYQPGDTATLLLTTALTETAALLVVDRRGGLEAGVRTIRAGEPFTVTIEPGDAPGLPVSVLVPRGPAAPGDLSGVAPLVSAILPVAATSQALAVAATFDQSTYAPGATATVTVTVANGQGAGVPARLIVGVVGGRPQPRDLFGAMLAARPLPELAQSPYGPPQPIPQPPAAAALPRGRPEPGAGISWLAGARAGAGGVFTQTIQLPDDAGEVTLVVWAALGPGVFGQARATAAVSAPLGLRLGAPPFFRQGDRAELLATFRNTTEVSQTVTAQLMTSGLSRTAETALPPAIAPGAVARAAWVVAAQRVSAAVAELAAGDPISQTVRLDVPIVALGAPPAGPPAGVGLDREYLDLAGQPLDPAALPAGRLVRIRITAVLTEAARLVAIVDPLPAGVVCIEMSPSAVFAVDCGRDRVTLASDALPAGAHEYTYVARAAVPGAYAAPPPTIVVDGRPAGRGQPLAVGVVRGP